MDVFGVIELYLQTKDIVKVQRQCRHSDIQQTNEYMRDLGLIDMNKELLNFDGF